MHSHSTISAHGDSHHTAQSAAPRFGVIADDLTGACDAGVQFTQAGFSAVVQLDSSACRNENAEVIIVSTNSRGDSPGRAKLKAETACRHLIKAERQIVFKKVDSTLKGNIYSETKAVMERCGFRLALLTPAFPALGRRVINGRLYIDATIPGSEPHLPSLLREQGACNVVHIDRAELRKENELLSTCLQESSQREMTIVTFDVETESDLARITKVAERLPQAPLMVGSAGLATEVAARLAEKYQKHPKPAEPEAIAGDRPGPVLLVIGSTNPVTKDQIEDLIASRPCRHFSSLDFNLREVLHTLKNNRNVVITFDLARTGKQQIGRLATILAKLVARGVILSGGDTALVVCRSVGAKGIRLEREILRGIPLGRLAGGMAHGMPVVTKAGGFGDRGTLALLAGFLAYRGGDFR